MHIPDSVNRSGSHLPSFSLHFTAFVRDITLLSQPSESDWAPGTEWRQSQQELSFSATVYSTVACSYWNLIHGFCVTIAVMNSVCLWFSNWQHHAKSEKHTPHWSNSEDRGRRKWEPITDASDYWLTAIYSSYRLVSSRLKGKSRCQMGFISICNSK